MARRSDSSTPLIIHPMNTPMSWITCARDAIAPSRKFPFIWMSSISVSETPFWIHPIRIAKSLIRFPRAVMMSATVSAAIVPKFTKASCQSDFSWNASASLSLPRPRTATETASKPRTARPATGCPLIVKPIPISVMTKSPKSRSRSLTTFWNVSNAVEIFPCHSSGIKFQIAWPRLERASFSHLIDSPSFPSVKEIFQPCVNPRPAR